MFLEDLLLLDQLQLDLSVVRFLLAFHLNLLHVQKVFLERFLLLRRKRFDLHLLLYQLELCHVFLKLGLLLFNLLLWVAEEDHRVPFTKSPLTTRNLFHLIIL